MKIQGQSFDMSVNSADILSGIAKELAEFSCVSYLDDLRLSDGLLSGAIKNAALIACSDMGSSVPYICSSANVQLFLFQNFGHGFDTGGFVETLVDYGVEDAVVYGHSGCDYAKVMARSFCSQAKNDALLRSTEKYRQLLLYSAALKSDSEALWEELAKYNVLLELRKMLDHALIGQLAARGALKLHGWFFRSSSKQLEIFDPGQGLFSAPLAGALEMSELLC